MSNVEGGRNNLLELLAKVIDCFPYPIQVYAPDGNSVMVNKALPVSYTHLDVYKRQVFLYYDDCNPCNDYCKLNVGLC